jgi:hypothetical protein
VDEAADQAGTVATIAIPGMKQPATTARAGPGEGSGRHHADPRRQALLPQCRSGRSWSIARRGDDRRQAIRYDEAAAWEGGDDATMADRAGTDAPSGRSVRAPVAAARGDGAGRLSRLWDAAGGLSARLGLGAAGAAVGLPRLRDHAVRSVADQPPPRSRRTAPEAIAWSDWTEEREGDPRGGASGADLIAAGTGLVCYSRAGGVHLARWSRGYVILRKGGRQRLAVVQPSAQRHLDTRHFQPLKSPRIVETPDRLGQDDGHGGGVHCGVLGPRCVRATQVAAVVAASAVTLL